MNTDASENLWKRILRSSMFMVQVLLCERLFIRILFSVGPTTDLRSCQRLWILFGGPMFTTGYVGTFCLLYVSQNKYILTRLCVWVYLYDGGSCHTTEDPTSNRPSRVGVQNATTGRYGGFGGSN